MLILYSSNTLSFSNLGLGVLRDFYNNPTITEVLNGEYNLEFEYVTGGWLSDNLVKGNIIKANGQLFRIWDVEQDLNKIKILAKHIFFDLSKNFLVDVSPTNLTANNAISWLLSRTATANSFSVTGNCTDVASARYVRKNVIDALTMRGFNKTDFSQWMMDDRFSILQDVRRLPEILKSKKASEVFLKENSREAKKILAVEEITTDKLKDVPYELLAQELAKRMAKIELREVEHLRDDSEYSEKLESLERAVEELKFVLGEVKGE